MLKRKTEVLWSELLKWREETSKEIKEIKKIKSNIFNEVLFDFRNLKIEKNEAANLLKEKLEGICSIKAVNGQMFFIIGFSSKNEVDKALNLSLTYNEVEIKKVALGHVTDEDEVIRLSELSLGRSLEETKEYIKEVMQEYGEILDIKVKLLYGLQSDEAIVSIKRNKKELPTKILINQALALVDYKGGPLRCWKCKNVGHNMRECRRNKNFNNFNKIENNQSQKQIADKNPIPENKKIEEMEDVVIETNEISEENKETTKEIKILEGSNKKIKVIIDNAVVKENTFNINNIDTKQDSLNSNNDKMDTTEDIEIDTDNESKKIETSGEQKSKGLKAKNSSPIKKLEKNKLKVKGGTLSSIKDL